VLLQDRHDIGQLDGEAVDPDPAHHLEDLGVQVLVVEMALQRGDAKAPLSRDELMSKCRANLAFAGRDAAGADLLARFADDLMAGRGAVDMRKLQLC
jgi:hypothetical protein